MPGNFTNADWLKLKVQNKIDTDSHVEAVRLSTHKKNKKQKAKKTNKPDLLNSNLKTWN